ncbi:hypothetical protein [uncultured Hydrogenophaga sp.]|uniref:hypothetical protein n=1 Tax=uncultured Hydrogenophaga sp. TaxID=199683 RepID=UPI0025881FB0|nr:hypothetical protein [uncultured Hydrogenophaga sp.]
MTITKRQLYAAGEPLGDCVTRREAGRLICGGGGGGGQSTTTQSIPEELKPLADAYVGKAINLGNTGYQPYGGQRYAGLNDLQQQGLDAIAQRATQGSQTVDNAEQQLNQVIAGGNTNPYLDQMVGRAQDSVRSGYNTAAVNSGSFGNAGLAEQAGRQMGEVATQMYGQAYDQDRARQMQAIGMAPQFGNQAYSDAQQILNAGQIKQDQQQQGLDFNYQQFQDQQNLPYRQLAAMAGPFGSNLGSTTTQSGGGK